MKQKVRIFLVEDHTILREGLRALLTADPNFEIIGEAADGREAVRFDQKAISRNKDNCVDGSQNGGISADHLAGRR
jgi:hypothetical protein